MLQMLLDLQEPQMIAHFLNYILFTYLAEAKNF